mgnify:CR=1 FL=1
MSRIQSSGYINQVDYKVLNDDVFIFRRGNRMYRLSNLANNWLPGKFFVLINANTADQAFEVADRINLRANSSRCRTAQLFADLWQLSDSNPVKEDLFIMLEILTDLGFTDIKLDPAKAPREFGKPWSTKGRNLRRKRTNKRRKLARV